MSLQWRIYYGDGSTFDNTQGEPDESPALNVQVITIIDPDVGRLLLHRYDFYWYDFDHAIWSAGDIFGMFDYLCQPGIKVVRFGRSIVNREYREIVTRAGSDPDFPRKSARLPGERA